MKLLSLKQISHSELRHRILSSLNLEPASSVTSLAQRLDVLRPSVSRAISSLDDAGLIIRQGRTISLSEAGKEELYRLDAELSNKVKKSTDLATRIVLEQATEAGKQLEPLFKSHVMESLSPLVRMGEELSNSPLLQIGKYLSNNPLLHIGEELANSPLLQVGKALSNSPLFQLGEMVNNSPILLASEVIANNGAALQAMEAVKATAHIQTVNLGLLQSWQEEIRSPLNHLVLANNVLLSKMMVDLEAISGLKAGVGDTLAGLISQTAWTTKVYDTYFADIVSGFNQFPTFDSLELSLAIPTTAAASLVGSTRFIVESETVFQAEREPATSFRARTHGNSESYVELTPKLEAYLKPLGQRFIDKWEGAWQTLYSGNKDCHSQATHSGRELLMQVLAYLAPDDVFSKEDCIKHGVDKPNRKMRIKYILDYDHRSTVELIDSMADTLDSMYHVLVGEAHRRDDKNHPDDTIAGQLGALGALLVMLLSLHKSNQT
jgi:DNA-binding MarR family transcriptional regulator